MNAKIDLMTNLLEQEATIEISRHNNCTEIFNGFECTRPKDHSGYHIAMGSRMCVIWAPGLPDLARLPQSRP